MPYVLCENWGVGIGPLTGDSSNPARHVRVNILLVLLRVLEPTTHGLDRHSMASICRNKPSTDTSLRAPPDTVLNSTYVEILLLTRSPAAVPLRAYTAGMTLSAMRLQTEILCSDDEFFKTSFPHMSRSGVSETRVRAYLISPFPK